MKKDKPGSTSGGGASGQVCRQSGSSAASIGLHSRSSLRDIQANSDKHFAGIITEPGSSLKYKTYVWRDGLKPTWIKKNCTNCLKCFVNCPDRAIKVDKDGNMAGHNLTYCKGCGICAQVCPAKPKAIEMKKE